jgi:hypothetical protein
MATKTYIAAIVGLVLVSSAGLAAATYQGRSIWGGNNPGQGADHAAMPEAAAEHNRAGADHPFPEHNETGDDNETGQEGGQPDDVPPAHAKDGEPSQGKPADVPPAHASADEHPAETGDDGTA